jgi:hypothetical protein
MAKKPLTLVAFLLERITEEETAALDSRRWYHGAGEPEPRAIAPVSEAFAAFVLAHDPDRVLTECVAKRRLINLITDRRWSGSREERDSLLRLIAMPYAGHPAFRDEWRTDGLPEPPE